MLADNDPAAEACTRRDYDRFCAVCHAEGGTHAGNGSVFDKHLDHLGLNKRQVRGVFKRFLHVIAVSDAVSLHTQTVYGGSLAGIEHARLKHNAVRSPAHLAAESGKLKNKMPLAGPADRRVAGHVADEIHIHCKYGGFFAHTGRRKRRFDSGVSRADDNRGKRKFSHSTLYFYDG